LFVFSFFSSPVQLKQHFHHKLIEQLNQMHEELVELHLMLVEFSISIFHVVQVSQNHLF